MGSFRHLQSAIGGLVFGDGLAFPFFSMILGFVSHFLSSDCWLIWVRFAFLFVNSQSALWVRFVIFHPFFIKESVGRTR